MSVHTFLLADLVGYTALTEAMGDHQAADVAADLRASVRTLLPDYNAQEVKTIGDALLLRVPSAGPAVHLATRLKSEFGTRHGSLALRVGVHTGSAVERDGDWFGNAVNIVARVAEQARPGEVLITSATFDAAREALVPGQIEPRGKHELKNVAEPVELLAVVTDGSLAERLPVDPVCQMAIDPQVDPPSHTRLGTTYYFCSTTCRDAFVRDPRHYTRRLTQRGPGRPLQSALRRMLRVLPRRFT